MRQKMVRRILERYAVGQYPGRILMKNLAMEAEKRSKGL